MTTVWHSDKLPQGYPKVFEAVRSILKKHGFGYQKIPGSKDIWCRDYMPVRDTDGSLVQFVYWPQYLRGQESANLITPPTCCRKALDLTPIQESVVILDGGGVEIQGGIGIVTERVFTDNYWYCKDALTGKLMETLKLKQMIVIPVEPGDETGHVDGVVRFVGEGRVVMNDYSQLTIEGACRAEAYGRRVEKMLRQAGLRVEKLPYAPTDSLGPDGMPPAIGCYTNFLRVDNLVILPQFQLKEDAQALSTCQQIFEGSVTVETVDCSTLAWDGGVLNCVSWF